MEIRFIKMEGLGNDYIFVDTRKCSFPSKLEEKLSNPEGGFKYLGPNYQIHLGRIIVVPWYEHLLE